MKTLGGVKGFHDIVPPESERFTALEDRLRGVLRSYNYDEIRIPIAERTELFARSLGETTDIVEKEMYTFDDRDGTSLTLRPEGTASVVRAAIEAGLAQRERVAKLYYSGPMFRRERPQRGRSRQFHQIGAELIGRDDPTADAETVVLFADCLAAAGVPDARILLNSLGDATCRPAYRAALTAYGEAHLAELCANCRQRLVRNPLRLLDCKEEVCRRIMADAPRVAEHLCEACRVHFDEVKRLLAAAGVAFSEDARLVRGLDYYVRTAFEALAPNLGAQNAVGGGGATTAWSRRSVVRRSPASASPSASSACCSPPAPPRLYRRRTSASSRSPTRRPWRRSRWRAACASRACAASSSRAAGA